MGLETATYIDGLVATNPTLGDPVSAGDDHLRLIKAAVKASFPNIAGAVAASHSELSHLAGVTSGVQDQLNAKSAVGHTHTEGDITDGVVFPRIDSTELITGSWAFNEQLACENGIWAKQGTIGYAGIFSAAGAAEPIRLRYQNLDYAASNRQWITYFTGTTWVFGTLADDFSTAKAVFGANRNGNVVTSVEYGNTVDNPAHNFRGAATFNNGLTATSAAIGNVSNTELQYLDGVTSALQTQLNGKAATSHSHNDLYYTEAEVNALIAAVPGETSGSFSAALRAFNGGTNLATATVNWRKMGRRVTLSIPALYTSDTTATLVIDNLPAACLPGFNTGFVCNGYNAGAFSAISADLNTAWDYIQLSLTNGGTFTATASQKGLRDATLTYITAS